MSGRHTSVERVPLIRLEGLTKTYQEGEHVRVVFRDLNLSMYEGEVVVLLGRSGSGKSTLLNLISGMDLPTDGQVFFGETNLTARSEEGRTLFRREHIGFVFQSFNLIPTLTVEENVVLPLELKGRLGAEEHERVQSVLEQVGLRDRADSFPDRLSGGEQQRVAIARALAHEPMLILADEPTGNLDYETAQHVMGLIGRLVRQAGRTMLIATHDHDLIDLADRVWMLQDGHLDERAPNEVVAPG